ncbi:MAG: hypothetical protein RR620_13200 [Clostridium sp.]
MDRKVAHLELRHYSIRKIEIQDIELELEELELDSSPLKAQQYSDMPKGSGANCPNNDSLYIKRNNLLMKKKRHELRNKRVELMVEKIDKEKEKDAVYKFYIEGKPMSTVIREMQRTQNHIKRLLSNGIDHIAKENA